MISLGALLYRDGKFEEAVELLTKASRALEQLGDSPSFSDFLPAHGWYFLAMAHHDLGHYQEAQTWFDKAEAYGKTAMAKPAAVSRQFPMPGSIYWHQRVVLEYLQREARSVLNIPDSKPE